MRVCILGPLRVEDEADFVAFGGRQQRRILAGLALRAGHQVSLDALETAAWGDEAPATARHTIATHVLRLRALGIEISTAADGYSLETPTDAAEFERLLGVARDVASSDPAGAVPVLREALQLWRGRPLPELDHVPEAEIETRRLDEVIQGARELLLRTQLLVEPPDALVAPARQFVAEQPYREHRWELLMLALYRSGRQAEALDVYSQARALLIEELGVEPGPALQRMQRAVLAQDPALDAPSVATTDGNPSRSRVPGTATRLIGRAQERQDLVEAWSRARLVALVGPPGAGKTRLALDAAAEVDGSVWYVDVDRLPPTQPVAAAVLDVIAPSSRSLDASDGMVEQLRDATGLVVLDGCERRRSEVAIQVRRVLAACAQIRVLVTSRERIGVLDEALIHVGPLPPDDALALLTDRARLVNSRFAVASTDELTADRLCGLVDRLPLALELVARHLNLLSVRELTARVEADLGHWAGRSAGGRDGLWVALDTSVAALSADERKVLLAFAVMVSDADTDLLADVVDPAFDGDLLEVVGRLVDASLVQVRSAVSSTRCQLLRTIAVHTLESAEGTAIVAARERYVTAVLNRVSGLLPRLASPQRTDAMRALDADMPHVREVFGELCGPGSEPEATTHALELATRLTDYWLGRRPAEGMEWLTRLIGSSDPPPALRAEALLRCGHMSYWLTDFVRGTEMASGARDLFRELGDPLGEGRALRRLGAIAAATDDLGSARRLLEESLRRLDEAGVEADTGITLLHLGTLLADEGDTAGALDPLRRALRIATDLGDPLARGQALTAMLQADWKGGNLGAAMHSGEVALDLFRELGHRAMEGALSYRLAAVARAMGRTDDARRYAQQSIDAGIEASTRTSTALGHLYMARLDLDDDHIGAAADHLESALDLIDPGADRWVLVEVLEGVARLLVALGRPGAGGLLDAAAEIRLEIRQPLAPTDVGDVLATTARVGSDREKGPRLSRSPDALHAAASNAIREIAHNLSS